jgi:predicted ATPase
MLPIIMAILEAVILEFTDGKIKAVSYRETEHYQLTKSFLDRPEVYIREL